jgi:hypothetical protein
MEKEIGKVIHYFNKAMVAVVKLTDKLAIGDTVKFVHGEHEIAQKVDSMQVEHKPVKDGKVGDEIAVKVDQETHTNAKVYKVTE